MGATGGSSTNHEIIFNFYVQGGGEVITKVGRLVSQLNEQVLNTVDAAPRVTKAWGEMSNAVESAGMSFAQSVIGMNAGGSALDRFGDLAFKMNNIMSQVQPVMEAFRGRAVAAWEAGSQFGQAIANMQTIMNNPVEGGKEMAEVMERILLASPKDSEDILTAGYDVLSAGFTDTADAAEVLVAANKLAIAGLGEVTEGVDVITSALNAYSLSSSHAEEVAESLFIANKIGKSTLSDIAEGYGKIIPISALARVGIDEVNAGIAVLSQTGLTAAESETNLRMALLSIIKPTKEMTQLIRSLGYQTGEALLEAEGLQGALTGLASATNGSQEAFARAFSRVQGLTAATLLGSLRSSEYAAAQEETRKAVESASTSMSVLDAATARVTGSTESLYKQMKAGFELIKRDQFELMEPAIRSVMAASIELFKTWSEFGKSNPLEALGKTMATMSLISIGALSAIAFGFAWMAGKVMLTITGLQSAMSGLNLDKTRDALVGVKVQQAELTERGQILRTQGVAIVNEQLKKELEVLSVLQRQNAEVIKIAAAARAKQLLATPGAGLISGGNAVDALTSNFADAMDKTNPTSQKLAKDFDLARSKAEGLRGGVDKATDGLRIGAAQSGAFTASMAAAAVAMGTLVEISARFVDLNKLEPGGPAASTIKWLQDNPGFFTIAATSATTLAAVLKPTVDKLFSFVGVFKSVREAQQLMADETGRTGTVMEAMRATATLMLTGMGKIITGFRSAGEGALAMGGAMRGLDGTITVLSGSLSKIALRSVLVAGLLAMAVAVKKVSDALDANIEAYREAEFAQRKYLDGAVKGLDPRYGSAIRDLKLPSADDIPSFTDIVGGGLKEFGGDALAVVKNIGATMKYYSGGIVAAGVDIIADFSGTFSDIQEATRLEGIQKTYMESWKPKIDALEEIGGLSEKYKKAIENFVKTGNFNETTKKALRALAIDTGDLDDAKSAVEETDKKMFGIFDTLRGIFDVNSKTGVVMASLTRSAENFAARNDDIPIEVIGERLQKMQAAAKNINELAAKVNEDTTAEARQQITTEINKNVTSFMAESMIGDKTLLDDTILSEVQTFVQGIYGYLAEASKKEAENPRYGQLEVGSDIGKAVANNINETVAPELQRLINERAMAAVIVSKLNDAMKLAGEKFSGSQQLASQVAEASAKLFESGARKLKLGKIPVAEAKGRAATADADAVDALRVQLKVIEDAEREFAKSLVSFEDSSAAQLVMARLLTSNKKALQEQIAEGGPYTDKLQQQLESGKSATEKTIDLIRESTKGEEETLKGIREAGSLYKKAFEDLLASNNTDGALAALKKSAQLAVDEQNMIAKINVKEAETAEKAGMDQDYIKAKFEAASAARQAAAVAGAKLYGEGYKQIIGSKGDVSTDERTRLSDMSSSYNSISESLKSMGMGAQSAAAALSGANAELRVLRLDMAGIQEKYNSATSAEEKDSFFLQLEARKAAIDAYADKIAYMYDAEDSLLTSIGKKFVEQGRSAGDLMDQMSDRGSAAIGEFSDAIVDWANGAKVNFADMARSILADMAKIAARQALMGIVSSIVGAIGSTSGAAAGSIDTGGGIAWDQGAYNAGRSFDTGGYVGPGGRKVQVMAHEGEGIFTPKQMNNADKLFKSMEAGRGGGGSRVVINNYGNSKVESKESKDPKTGEDMIEVLVTEMEGKMKSRMDRGGGMAPYFESNYGMKRNAGRSL